MDGGFARSGEAIAGEIFDGLVESLVEIAGDGPFGEVFYKAVAVVDVLMAIGLRALAHGALFAAGGGRGHLTGTWSGVRGTGGGGRVDSAGSEQHGCAQRKHGPNELFAFHFFVLSESFRIVLFDSVSADFG